MKDNKRQYLDELIRLDKNFESTEKTLNIFNNSFCLSSLINRILNDDDLITKIASNSYYHDNGFQKITFFSGKNFNLRIHIHWNDKEQKKSNIHDHRWNFSSLILSGGYISEIFEISDKGLPKELFHYFPKEKLTGNYSLHHIGKVFLKRIGHTKYTKSDINHGTAGEIHKITYTSNEPTITVFVTGKHELNHARVLSDDMLSNEKIMISSISNQDLILTLKKIKKIAV